MLWRALLIGLAALVAAPVVFGIVALEREPAIEAATVPDAGAARRTRELFREFRALTETDAPASAMRITEDDLDGAIAFAARAVPGLRGDAELTPAALLLTLSWRSPALLGGRWLNLRASVAPSTGGIDLAALSVGPIALPARLVLPTAAMILDLGLGDGLGTVAVNSIDRLMIEDDAVVIGVAMTYAQRKLLALRAKGAVRAAAFSSSVEDVRRYYQALQHADAPPGQQSLMPYLRLTIDGAASAEGPPLREMQAALFALAIFCGDVRFQNLTGDVVPERRRSDPTACADVRLGGRIDLRRHFVISAALHAASDEGPAFVMGEMKELLDSGRGGSGFSFDDLAADRAGIRFGARLLSADPAAWRDMSAALTSEDAVFPDMDSLPSGLSQAEFLRRFGEVDSAPYLAMLEKIDARIARLVFHSSAERATH